MKVFSWELTITLIPEVFPDFFSPTTSQPSHIDIMVLILKLDYSEFSLAPSLSLSGVETLGELYLTALKRGRHLPRLFGRTKTSEFQSGPLNHTKMSA